MDAKSRVAQLLSAAQTNMQNNANRNINVGLRQVQPLAPPTLTYLELLSADIADYRDLKNFDGKKAYRYACILRARSQRLSLPFRTISLMATQLWDTEPGNIQDIYKDIAAQATRTHEFHYEQFQ